MPNWKGQRVRTHTQLLSHRLDNVILNPKHNSEELRIAASEIRSRYSIGDVLALVLETVTRHIRLTVYMSAAKSPLENILPNKYVDESRKLGTLLHEINEK